MRWFPRRWTFITTLLLPYWSANYIANCSKSCPASFIWSWEIRVSRSNVTARESFCKVWNFFRGKNGCITTMEKYKIQCCHSLAVYNSMVLTYSFMRILKMIMKVINHILLKAKISASQNTFVMLPTLSKAPCTSWEFVRHLGGDFLHDCINLVE